MDANLQTVSPPRTKRHFRTADERRRMVEETMTPGVSVATVARAHGVNANLLFVWRKQYHAGLLGSSRTASANESTASCVRLLPVTVADVEVNRQASSMAVSTACKEDRATAVSPGVIELTLPKAQVRITGDVDVAVLRTLMECLRG